MTFINKESVNTKFLKGYNIIFTALVIELFKFLLYGFSRFFKLLNRKVLSTISLQIRNAICQFFKLLLQNCPLSFYGHRYFFKLRMTDNYSVIISGCDSTAELLAVLCFEVFFCRNKNISCRIELQELRRPLLCQMIWYNEQRFIAKSKPFRLHSSCHHFKGFTGADCVCKQGITAIKNMSHSIFLMFTQLNFRVHTIKDNVTTVILTRTNTVKFFVIHLRKFFTSGRVSPYPILKALLYKFLFCLCDCRFFFV